MICLLQGQDEIQVSQEEDEIIMLICREGSFLIIWTMDDFVDELIPSWLKDNNQANFH